MRTARALLVAAIGAMLALPGIAQSGPPRGGSWQPKAPGGQETVRTKKLKADIFMKQVDKDGDGKITREEWQAAGLSDRGFEVLDGAGPGGAVDPSRKKLGYLTKEELESFDFKAEVDSNNDGNLTLRKLLAYEKSMASMPPPPAGGPGVEAPSPPK